MAEPMQTKTIAEILALPVDEWTRGKLDELLAVGVPDSALVEVDVLRDENGVALPDGFHWLARWPGAEARGHGPTESDAWENLLRGLA